MKPSLKNTLKTTSPSFFFFLAKLSFTALFFVAYGRTLAYMDASHPWQMGFQDPATPIMEGIIFFNGLLMAFMIFIACLVGWLLYKSLSLFDESVHADSVGFTHSTLLEVVWTIIPALILMLISIPSYNLLYAMDEVIDPSLTIKVVGHQWYWSYECSDFEVAPNEVGPKLDSPAVRALKDSYTLLRGWVTAVDWASLEAEMGEKQTHVTLMKDFLDFLKDNMEGLSDEEAVFLENRLLQLNLLFFRSEGAKEAYGSLDELKSGVLADILSSTKAESHKPHLQLDHQRPLMEILKYFKQLLRITEDIGNENDRMMAMLRAIKQLQSGELLAYMDSEGGDDGSDKDSDGDEGDSDKDSDGGEGGSDKDSDDGDDGSLIGDLMDFDKSNPYWEWCELVAAEREYDRDDAHLTRAASEALLSERTCTNAAAMPETNNTPFSDLMERMRLDRREFKRAIPIADLSEDKLIDTQLIGHQLRLTRPEREAFSSEYAWNSAVVASNFAEFEFKNALSELEAAKLHSHWAKIELAAARVNKLTAEYLQADASLGVTDPLLIRGLWINKKGYYSWNDFLRLAIKKLSDAERLVFLHADEELNGANSLLGKAQRGLTPEERDKSNSIADNAKAEFMAMEREVIPAVEEFMRGKLILANAKSELNGFQEISDRADIRLERAQTAFDQAKPISDRTQARFKAAESVFKAAQASLGGSELITESVSDKAHLDLTQLSFDKLTTDFDTAVSNLHAAKSELLAAEERFEQVKINLEKTEKVFADTGLLEKQTPVEGKPTEYYHNFLWEIHNEDLSFVKAQLKTDKAELDFANLSLDSAEKNLSRVGGELLEAELNTNKALINYLNNNNSDFGLLNNTKKHVSGIELKIAQAISLKALSDFESKASDISKAFLERAERALDDALLEAPDGYLGSALEKHSNDIDCEKLISDYAESCLIRGQEELKGAEADYAKASRILAKAESFLEGLGQDLSKDYDNPYLETLRALHKKTLRSLEGRIDQLNLTRLESSPLDIKLEPGFLQSRSYREVLLAKAELANSKWLCARVAKTLDIPLSEEVRPFNVQFSHLKPEDFSPRDICGSDVGGSAEGGSVEGGSAEGGSAEGGSADGGSADGGCVDGKCGGKRERTPVKIDGLLFSKEGPRDLVYSGEGLRDAILISFANLIYGWDADDERLDPLFSILDEAFARLAREQKNQNQDFRDEIAFVKQKLTSFKGDGEGDEEKQPINFDSYLIGDDDLVIPEASGTGKAGTVFRLLEVDNRLFVPTNTHIRVLITSADVLHSWAVPSLGVKVDACPGRLNQVFLFVKREGVFYGQCSELCGVNHGFMPIVVQAVSQDEYLTWVGKRLCS